MGESEMPADEYKGKEKKWSIQFHSWNLQSATIYFDEVDARKFKEKVNESLDGLKQLQLPPIKWQVSCHGVALFSTRKALK